MAKISIPTFRSSLRGGGGFDPIEVPDGSRRYAEETQRILAGRRRAQNQENTNHAQRVQRGKEAAAKSRRSLQEVESFREELVKAEREIEVKSLQQELWTNEKQAELKGQQNKAVRDFLFTMLPQYAARAAEGINQMEGGRRTRLAKEGKRILASYGLTATEQRTYLFGESTIEETEKGLQAIKARLQNDGILTGKDLENFGQLSGYREFGARQAWAQAYGKTEYLKYLAQNQQTPIKLPNGDTKPFSWILNYGGIDELDRAREQLDTEWFSKFNEGHVLINQEMTPWINNHWDDYEKAVHTREIQSVTRESAYADSQVLFAKINRQGGIDPTGGFIDQVNVLSAGGKDRKQVRQELLSIIATSARAGHFDYDTWHRLKEGGVLLDGATKSQPFRVLYKDDIAVVDDAFNEYFKDWDANKKDNTKRTNSFLLYSITEGFHEKNGKPSTRQERIDFAQKHWGSKGLPLPSAMKDLISMEQQEDSLANQTIQDLLDRGELTFFELSSSGKYSNAIITKFKDDPRVVNGPGSVPQNTLNAFRSAVYKEIAKKANQQWTSDTQHNVSGQTILMQEATWRKVKMQWEAALATQTHKNPTSALQAVWELERTKINSDDPTYALNTHENGNPILGKDAGWKRFSTGKLDYDTKGTRYSEEARKDDEWIYTPGNLTQSDVNELIRWSNKPYHNTLPNWVFQVKQDAYGNLGVSQFVKKLIKSHKGKVPPKLEKGAEVEKQMSKESPRVNNKPSLAKTRNAAGAESTLALIADTTAFNHTNGEPYTYSTQDGQPQPPNEEILNTSVQDHINKDRTLGSSSTFGAFNLNSDDLQMAINFGWVEADDLLSVDTQKSIALYKIDADSSIFSTNGVYIPGLGRLGGNHRFEKKVRYQKTKASEPPNLTRGPIGTPTKSRAAVKEEHKSPPWGQKRPEGDVINRRGRLTAGPTYDALQESGFNPWRMNVNWEVFLNE